jgi:SpoVK/Ycf46/Vps4 family AAA+-type ATPase
MFTGEAVPVGFELVSTCSRNMPKDKPPMSAEQSVIKAIETAVEAAPTNVALRVHLAQLLINAGQADQALTHARAVLAVDPVNREALGLAALTAGLCGQKEAEAGYATLLQALRGISMTGPTHTANSESDVSSTSAKDHLKQPSIDPGPEATNVYTNDVERSNIRLNDVAGMQDVKQRLEMAFLGPARNEELRAAFGTSMRGGLLLYGPPGCGKTFIAKALAGELGASFFSIGLTDVLDMWIGASEKNLHDVFETARRSTPCLLFLDEVDAIGQKRSQLRNATAMRSVVAQLLAEMDGFSDANDGLFVLGATNAPWDVDAALRRPGRFDRTVLVLPPDGAARDAILRLHLSKRPLASDLDLRSIVEATSGFAGADLAHLCETAAQKALAASLASGTIRPIGNHDLRSAIKEVFSSVGPWFETAENYANFANQSGEYDDLLTYIRSRPKRSRRDR